jgi:hypothetical protein
MRQFLAAALLLSVPASAIAQENPASCPKTAPVSLPADLAGWAHSTAVSAARDGTAAGHVVLAPGLAVNVSLLSTPDVHYPVRPEHPGGTVSHGGILSFDATVPGDYRVASSSSAWIEVARDGKTVKSIAHGHGPACSGIMKMVYLKLAPGRYFLEVSGNGKSDIKLMVVRMP